MKISTTNFLIQTFLVSLIVCVIIVLAIRKYIYFHPSRKIHPTSEPYKLISVSNLHGWLLEGNIQYPKIIVFCHGNTGNLSDRIDKALSMRNTLGHSVLLFDYTGYGKSHGIPSVEQCYNDTALIITTLIKDGIPKENIILYGEDIGASIAAFTAKRYSIPVLIIESAILNMSEYINNKYRLMRIISKFFQRDFNLEDNINGYQGDVICMHAKTDEVSPYPLVYGFIIRVRARHIQIDGSHYNPIINWVELKAML